MNSRIANAVVENAKSFMNEWNNQVGDESVFIIARIMGDDIQGGTFSNDPKITQDRGKVAAGMRKAAAVMLDEADRLDPEEIGRDT